MTGFEIILLVIGCICVIVSYLFFSNTETKSTVGTELTNKQKEDMKNQIISIFDDQSDDLKEKTEIMLDKISNQKMMEMNEYSETILSEINRNHSEVVFLYDMLNEKKKEVNNTIKEINLAQKKLSNKQPNEMDEDIGFMSAQEIVNQDNKKPARTKTKREKVLDQLDAVGMAVSDNVDADESANTTKSRRKTSTAKTAATRTRTTVKKETERNENKDITVFGNGNSNEKILELSSKGKSNVEIAKELGLGLGEVKLVIDLFRGGK